VTVTHAEQVHWRATGNDRLPVEAQGTAQTTQPLDQARPVDALTTPGLVVGSLCAVALGLGCAYATMVLRGSYMDLDFSTPGALFILFVLVLLSSGLLRRLAPRLALTPAELTTAYIMLLMASAIPTMGLIGQIVPLIAAPRYFATPENKWETILWPYLPQWTGPTDPTVVTGMFEGWARGAVVPWTAWLKPLAAWLPMVGALHFAMVCVMVLFRRQWVDHERLPYPVTQLPLAMATGFDSGSATPFFRQTIMWLGFGAAFIYASMIGLHHYFPQVPLLQVAWLFPVFRRRTTLILRLSFPMLGFFYLVPLDTLFSLWVLNLVFFSIRGVLGILGLELRETLIFGTNSAMFAHVGFGAMLALVVAGLRVGRFHLADVWRKAIGRAPEVDDSQELISYRAALVGLLVCVLVMAVWLSVSGMPLALTLPFLLIAFTLFFGLTRIVSEMGVAEAVASAIAPGMSVSLLGSAPWGQSGIAALGLSHVWNSDIRTFVMASAANSLKLSSMVGLRGRRLLLGMLLAIGLSTASALFVTLRQAYLEGGVTLNGWFFNSGPNVIWKWTADRLANPTGPNWAGTTITASGAAAFLLFTFMRQRFAWWPFHPVALCIAPVWIMDQLWFMAFAAWILKLLILRYGGLKMYGRYRSVFLGLILGQYVANGVWLFIDHFSGTRGNQIFWI
jgi:hypothetical protein